jgi:hypothetical protein
MLATVQRASGLVFLVFNPSKHIPDGRDLSPIGRMRSNSMAQVDRYRFGMVARP